jgi:hypothetical protein
MGDRHQKETLMSTLNTPTRQIKTAFALSFALLSATIAGSASAGDRPFSFRESLYYMDNDDALNSVKGFIATQLPSGLSRTDAAARLVRAGMDCARPKASNTLDCSYYPSVQDEWTVHVKLDGQGDVSRARVDHEIIGWASN